LTAKIDQKFLASMWRWPQANRLWRLLQNIDRRLFCIAAGEDISRNMRAVLIMIIRRAQFRGTVFTMLVAISWLRTVSAEFAERKASEAATGPASSSVAG